MNVASPAAALIGLFRTGAGFSQLSCTEQMAVAVLCILILNEITDVFLPFSHYQQKKAFLRKHFFKVAKYFKVVFRFSFLLVYLLHV